MDNIIYYKNILLIINVIINNYFCIIEFDGGEKVNKKIFIIALLALILFSLNFSVAQDVDNSTDIGLSSDLSNNEVSESESDVPIVSSSDRWDTQFEVNKTKFDNTEENFKVYLIDEDKNPVSNVKISFIMNGVTYNKNTNDKGLASLPIKLNDGIYKITTTFAGNGKYSPTSKTTTITVNNVRVVDAGLSNQKIQKIIDDAKPGNVILFKGKNYDNVNLVINKKLTLLSQSGTTLKSSSSNPVITITGKNSNLTTIDGFTIQGAGNGILISDSAYVTIKNNMISNSNNAIVAIGANYLNITDNKITSNSGDGILLAKSNHVYIYYNTILNNKNGIELNKIVGGVNYNHGPENVYIVGNTISKNRDVGLLIKNAGNNINVNLNTIDLNEFSGISMGTIGNNKIQSNVITNSKYGIVFIDQYLKPEKQDISYNAIFAHTNREIEARDTLYDDVTNKLEIGDNWYTDYNTLCPKLKTNNLKFSVKQIGPNQYQAVFLDSNNNVASLLPDRTLTFTTEDGQSVSVVISGGAGVFTVDENTKGKVKATVDDSDRINNHKSDSSTVSEPITGKTPTYDYPNIPYNQAEYYESDEGNGEGYGYGQGAGDNSGDGGDDSFESSDFINNGTSSQKASPSSQSSSPIAQVSQSLNTQGTASQSSASKSESGGAGNSQPQSQSQSVVKQIVLDEKEIYKVAGISFIILLILLTTAFYYRDDIKEMKSKM